MELEELLPAFAARLGIEGLAVRDGACALEIDGMPVDIAQVPGGDGRGKGVAASACLRGRWCGARRPDTRFFRFAWMRGGGECRAACAGGAI